MERSDETQEARSNPEQERAGQELVVDDDRRGEPVGGEDLDLGAETGTDVQEGTGGATAGDASPVDVTTAEDLERAPVDPADDLGAGVGDFGLGAGGDRLERDLGDTSGDYFGGPGEIDTGPERGLEGANSHDYPPNLRSNLKLYAEQARTGKESDVNSAYDAASADLAEFERTALDVEPADPAEHQPSGGGLMDESGPSSGAQQLKKAMDEIDELSSEPAAATNPPNSVPIDQNEELPSWVTDPSEGWGDDPSDPFDHDIGYTDPVDQVDSTTGGIPPTEAPTDMFEQYEEGYLPPDGITGNEIPEDGHLDPLINPE